MTVTDHVDQLSEPALWRFSIEMHPTWMRRSGGLDQLMMDVCTYPNAREISCA